MTTPGALGTEPADIPTLTTYLPGKPDGSVVIVLPGGGYGALADHEGEPIARWLNTLGITAYVLFYRLGPRYRHPVMLGDARRAVRFVRSHATEWKIDAGRIGILGFSAGGHLASTASTQFEAGDPTSADPVERVSSRPDLSVLLYPVITMTDPFTHTGSRLHLLGPEPTPEQIAQMSSENRVTKDTPPAFLFHTADDAAVPVENSIAYARALHRAGVRYALHVFERGRHGVGLATDDPILSDWPLLCGKWLKSHGFGAGT